MRYDQVQPCQLRNSRVLCGLSGDSFVYEILEPSWAEFDFQFSFLEFIKFNKYSKHFSSAKSYGRPDHVNADSGEALEPRPASQELSRQFPRLSRKADLDSLSTKQNHISSRSVNITRYLSNELGCTVSHYTLSSPTGKNAAGGKNLLGKCEIFCSCAAFNIRNSPFISPLGFTMTPALSSK